MAKTKKQGAGQYPLRLPDGLRSRVEKTAKDRNVSINAEILERLEQSFEIEDRVGGLRVVELILTIGAMMKIAGEHAAFFFDGSKLHNQGQWIDQPYAFDQATKAANAILKHYKPKGKVTAPKVPTIRIVGGDPKETEKRVKWMFEHLGEGLAETEMRNREEKK